MSARLTRCIQRDVLTHRVGVPGEEQIASVVGQERPHREEVGVVIAVLKRGVMLESDDTRRRRDEETLHEAIFLTAHRE